MSLLNNRIGPQNLAVSRLRCKPKLNIFLSPFLMHEICQAASEKGEWKDELWEKHDKLFYGLLPSRCQPYYFSALPRKLLWKWSTRCATQNNNIHKEKRLLLVTHQGAPSSCTRGRYRGNLLIKLIKNNFFIHCSILPEQYKMLRQVFLWFHGYKFKFLKSIIV